MKNILFLVFLILAGVCRAQSYYEQGEKEFYSDNENDLVTAVVLFTKAIDNKQDLARSYMMRGASRYRLGQYANAEIDLMQSLSMDSIHYEIYGYLGRLRSHQMDYAAALIYYDKAIAINDLQYGKRMDLYGERGAVKVLLKDYAGCIADEDISISIDSGQGVPYINRGYAKYQLKKYNEALKDYNKGVRLHPSANAYAGRGAVLYEMKQYQRAVDDFTRALAQTPEDCDALFRRGRAYKALGMKDKARADFIKSKQMGYAPAGEEFN